MMKRTNHKQQRFFERDCSQFNNLSVSKSIDQNQHINSKKPNQKTVKKQNLMILIEEDDYMPITNSIKLGFHTQRESQPEAMRNVLKRDLKGNQICKSIINQTDSKFSIQSQPNQMVLKKAQYFRMGETDYKSRQFEFQKSKQPGAIRLLNILTNFNKKEYLRKVSFLKIKQTSDKKLETFMKSFGNRNLHAIHWILQSNSLNKYDKNSKIFNQHHNNQNMLFYRNKLIGARSLDLIQNQTAGQTQKITQYQEVVQNQKLQEKQKPKNKQVVQPNQENEQKYQNQEKILKKYKKQKSQENQEKAQESMISQQSQKSYIFNFDIKPRRPKKQSTIRINDTIKNFYKK